MKVSKVRFQAVDETVYVLFFCDWLSTFDSRFPTLPTLIGNSADDSSKLTEMFLLSAFGSNDSN